jgi:SAM-dependent methyltransferase
MATQRGCREPYALLRILEATSAVVVDKEAEYIRNARSWFRKTQAQYPELFGAYELRFVVSDMTREADELAANCFDLAYCSGVLYFMRSDAGKLQAAVNTMARVVKPGGWVIANEDKGLDRYFEKAGLRWSKWLDNPPESAYCYRKLT